MKIEYHNLYTHFILITQNRAPSILQNHHERIEKYITGIINNNNSKLYRIYANPEHTCLPAGRFIFLPRVLQKYLRRY
jgi:REP element-mobilizing transposase RayT